MQGFFLGFSWLSLHPTRAQVEPQPRQGSTAPNPHPALRRGLEEEGFEVAQATLGHDAVALAEAEPPDLLIIDIGLPRENGLDLVRNLRSRGSGMT